MKTCTKCRVVKPLIEFNKRGEKGSTQYRSACKRCSQPPKPRTRTRMSTEEQKASAKRALAKYNASEKGKRNRAKLRAFRYERLKNATPTWLTEEQREHIIAYYETARLFNEMFGSTLTVDHVIPLKGEIMSGLHVPWNLQLMEKSANSSKRNKVEL